MWNDKISIKQPIVKVDYFEVTSLEESENKEYEFLFNYSIKFKEIKEFNVKKVVEKTYNLGKLIDDKFTYIGVQFVNNKSNKKDYVEVKKNIFLKAINDTHFEVYSRINSLYQDAQEKFKNVTDNDGTITIEDFVIKEKEKLEHEIYVRRLKEMFKEYKINNKDESALKRNLKLWAKTCGLSEDNVTNNRVNLFPIILLSHQMYLYTLHKVNLLEVNVTQTMEYINGKYVSNMFVETINDLIYYLFMHFCKSEGHNFIICDICGNLAVGTKAKHTCSERCKRIRNGNYNKKKKKV